MRTIRMLKDTEYSNKVKKTWETEWQQNLMRGDLSVIIIIFDRKVFFLFFSSYRLFILKNSYLPLSMCGFCTRRFSSKRISKLTTDGGTHANRVSLSFPKKYISLSLYLFAKFSLPSCILSIVVSCHPCVYFTYFLEWIIWLSCDFPSVNINIVRGISCEWLTHDYNYHRPDPTTQQVSHDSQILLQTFINKHQFHVTFHD